VKTALNVIRGADRVARLYVGMSRKVDLDFRYEIREVNGWPALVIRRGAAIASVTALETDGDVVFGIRVCLNPAKLAAMSRTERPSRH
jgi:RNA polymerase sigma-70 factor (ECF subfamily)